MVDFVAMSGLRQAPLFAGEVDMDLHTHSHEFSIGMSILVGALHALEPGHGKTVLVAHLLTEKRNVLKPILLALSTAVTHAASIFITAMVAHGLLHVALDANTNVESFYRRINAVSGIILLVTAYFVLKRAKQKAISQFQSLAGDHVGYRADDHTGGNCSCAAHRRRLKPLKLRSESSWRTIALGFAVGLIPCPSALVALSSAVTSGNWATAILLICAYSLGIFVALMILGAALGLKGDALVHGMKAFKKNPNLSYQLQSTVIVLTGAWHIWIGLT